MTGRGARRCGVLAQWQSSGLLIRWFRVRPPGAPLVLTWRFLRQRVPARCLWLRFWLRFFRVGPQHAPDAFHRFAGQRVRGIGVDTSRICLGVAENALYHVHIHVLFSQQSAASVPGAVHADILGDPGLG